LFDSSRLRTHAEDLMDDFWDLSHERRIMVRAALDIWDGKGNVFLWELLDLNDERLASLLDAIKIYKGQFARKGIAHLEGGGR